MPNYRVSYSQSAYGSVVVEADNEDDARGIVYDGNIGTPIDETDNLEITDTELIEPHPAETEMTRHTENISDRSEHWCLKCGKAGVFNNDICSTCDKKVVLQK